MGDCGRNAIALLAGMGLEVGPSFPWGGSAATAHTRCPGFGPADRDFFLLRSRGYPERILKIRK